jgi:hypothetical protein
MAMHKPEEPAFPPTALPDVEETILRRMSHEPDDLDTLFDNFKAENPRLAWWLMSEAQRIAPDIAEKEKYALLALRLYAVLSTQVLVNNLRAAYASDEFNPLQATPQTRHTVIPPHDSAA